MTTLAPTLEAFFTDRLMRQRRASPNTVAGYRDSFRLLLAYLQVSTGKSPSSLTFEDLDVDAIMGFLAHLEADRASSPRTCNARLAAIRAFFGFAALRHPEHAALIQRVLAIPHQRTTRALVKHLSNAEVDALLGAPDRSTRVGRRDHAILVLAIQTGLRVGELRRLRCGDVVAGSGAHVRTTGKGRKERCTPLTATTVAVLGGWLRESGGMADSPLFPGRCSDAFLSADAVQRLITKHVAGAATHCPSLKNARVTPHVLRHTCAMRLLAAGIDQSVIALWLGHERVETTDIYIHADLSIKERALAMTAPTSTTQRRYRVPDALLTFLEAL